MDGAGHELLAGAVLAVDQDAAVARRGHRDLLAQLSHRLALADHRAGAIDLRAQRPILVLEAPLTQRVAAISLVAHQIFFPAAAIGVLALILGSILHGAVAQYLPLLEIIAAMTTVVVLGITLPPYLALKRGSLMTYVKTMASVPPLMVYLAFSNGAKVVQTLRGRKSPFKRTPKIEHAPQAAAIDADVEA